MKKLFTLLALTISFSMNSQMDDNSANNNSAGSNSVAMGYSTTASGNHSTAMGYETTASGGYSFAVGKNTNANDDYSIAMGNYSTASGTGSTAFSDSTAPTISSVTANWGDFLTEVEDDVNGTVTVVTSGAEDEQTVTLTIIV